MEAFISKALTYSYIGHDEFGLINNMLNESDDMKVEFKNPNNK